jgi:hypothetical protein
MTRLAALLEGLDYEHATAAARARACGRLCRIGLVRLLSLCRSIGRRWVQVQELTTPAMASARLLPANRP